jgi:hypothetical protein
MKLAVLLLAVVVIGVAAAPMAAPWDHYPAPVAPAAAAAAPSDWLLVASNPGVTIHVKRGTARVVHLEKMSGSSVIGKMTSNGRVDAYIYTILEHDCKAGVGALNIASVRNAAAAVDVDYVSGLNTPAGAVGDLLCSAFN